jgi:CRISPR-associated endonuclease Csn1
MWFDRQTGSITTGTSIFPAGVDETEEKRGDPKNAKRRMMRRTRITLRRRAQRKRELRLKLIQCGLLPATAPEFKALLETTDPWQLRRDGLDKPLSPHQFGRVLLHMAQRRGALGLNIRDLQESAEPDQGEDGKVKGAIGDVKREMVERYFRGSDAELKQVLETHAEFKRWIGRAGVTFGRLIADKRDERVHRLLGPDPRPKNERKGPREYRDPVRNKQGGAKGGYEHCADRAMIRDEFRLLWEAQKKHTGETSRLLTDSLRAELDNEQGDSIWRHKGLLFGQRRQTWDLGTLGRCVLEPTERCAPHADMHASRYLVVETLNNLRIIERGKPGRALTREEREKIKNFLSGPLGFSPARTVKGKTIPERSKTTVSVMDLRELMGWGKATKTTPCRFNIEADEDREINTDWFSREIVHGAIGAEMWAGMPGSLREGINRAILKHDPEQDRDGDRLKAGVMKWAGLNEKQAAALTAAWAKRPKLDTKRLNMSRRAVRNLLTVMDRPEPWPEPENPTSHRWLTQIEARKLLAGDADFRDVTTGNPMDNHTRHRYATGAKGATAKDRHYMGKHVLMKDGKPIIGPDGNKLAEPPPAPLISNPVVRKAIHEVRRHIVEYMTKFGRKPDEIYIELAREARMGAKDSDRALFRNRLRNRIRNDIIEQLQLHNRTPTQQRAAVHRVVLCVQQGGASAICPLCGQGGLTPRKAADGDGCEVAHIIPTGSGGHNGSGNIVLSHTKCNRDMGRRTPREFWSSALKGGFDEGFRWVEGIFGDVGRPKPAEVKKAEGDALWACYFDWRDDKRKIEQFSKDVNDIQDMTQRQEAATKYAARQVMAYLCDVVFGGKGLPERSGGSDARTIFASDGLWTSRLRREWGLFFDPHHAKAKGLSNEEEHGRKEKNRGDHRHHAIDAVVIGLCTRSVQVAWEEREKVAEAAGINTADEEVMENYRRLHPLDPPAPYKTREELRDVVEAAIFGDEKTPRPICHRPVKRKLIGAFHKATQYGPVVDRWIQGGEFREQLVGGRVTIRQPILGGQPGDFLKPSHLRARRQESETEAIERITRRLRIGKSALGEEDADKVARRTVRSNAYTPAMIEPKPEKGGIVRDPGLKRLLRALLAERGLDPDKYTQAELKHAIAEKGPLRHRSGVPIFSVTLLWSNSEPVAIRRNTFEYGSGARSKDYSPSSLRLYDGQNNHHVEIRSRKNKQGREVWSGEIVTGYEVAQRKLAKLRAFRVAKIPKPDVVRGLPKPERTKLRPIIASIEKAHPLVNRTDDDSLGGQFIMSLCEGETVYMLHKETKEPGYFVVAKLDRPQQVVLVPHWDARAARERKDSNGNVIPDSSRESFTATPSDLATLAPPGHPHAVKVRVSPLAVVTVLEKD